MENYRTKTNAIIDTENMNNPSKCPRLNIVLDLDETLIGGCFQESDIDDNSDRDSDNDDEIRENKNIKIIKDDKYKDVKVKSKTKIVSRQKCALLEKDIFLGVGDPKMIHRYRPHLVEFIDYIKDRYNIYIYTNGNKLHYENVIKNIQRVIDFKVSGCSYRHAEYEFDEEDVPLKTLDKFELSPHNTIIIDDNKYAWHEKYRGNIINIPIFYVDIYDEYCGYIYDSHLKTVTDQLKKLGSEFVDIEKIVKSINEIFIKPCGLLRRPNTKTIVGQNITV